MLDAVGKIVLVSDFIELMRRMASSVVLWVSTEERVKAAEALQAVRRATSATRDFIDRHGYVRDTELESLWLNAMTLVAGVKGVGAFPSYLDSKARFWGRPQDWINNPTTLDLIPRLHEIEEMCDTLLRRLE